MKLLVLHIMIATSTAIYVNDTVVIASAVKQYFRSTCIYLLHDNETGWQEQTMILDEMKLFFSHDTILATLSSHDVSVYAENLRCKANIPLHVFPHDEYSARRILHQLSGSVRLPDAKWLLFLERDSRLESFFAGIDIPFDCEMVVAQAGNSHEFVLTEVYRVGPSLPLQTHRLGNFTDGGTVSWPSQHFYARRNKMPGLVLKTGVVEDRYSVIIREDNNKPLEVGGLFGDIWKVLEEQIDFRTDYYKQPDDSFGVKLGNGSWNGAVGLVLRGEVHVSISSFMYNAPRMEVVDYLDPMTTGRIVVYVRKSDSTVLVWNSFFLPFSPGVWMSLVVCLFVLSAALMLIDRTRVHNRKQDTREGLLLEFSRSLFSAITPFCWQGSNLARAEVSWRIIQLMMYLAAVVMLASYSASVLSYIMTKTDKLPFNTFEEFLEIGTYNLGVGKHVGHFTHFETSRDPVLRVVYDRHIAPFKRSLPNTNLEALNLVCARHNYAAIDLEDILPYYSNKVVCNLQAVPKASVEFKVSMIIQKRSPYLGIFRRTVHDMHRGGILNIINKRNSKKIMEMKEAVFISVSLTQVTPIFVLLATGALIAILLLKVELIVHTKTLRTNK